MARSNWRWLAPWLLMSSVALASCGESSHTTATRPQRTAFPTPPACAAKPNAALPLFNDWRIAYLSDDHVVHAYALDGTSDLAGPRLGSVEDLPLVSPDGRMLAYYTEVRSAIGTGLCVVPLRLAPRAADVAMTTEALYVSNAASAKWSPDSHWLGFTGWVSGTMDYPSAIYVMDAQRGRVTQVPHTTHVGWHGWADAGHLLLVSDAGKRLLVDVTTGADIEVPLPPNADTLLSPDGRRALLIMIGQRDQHYEVLFDMASGTVRQLPTFSAAIDAPGAVVWQPGTSRVAGVSAKTPTQPAMAALFDLDADTVTPLPRAAGLTPLLWLPGGQTLLLYHHDDGATHDTYYLLSPFTPNAQPQALPSNVTHVFGFVRTSDTA